MGDSGLPVSLGIVIASAILGGLLFIGLVVMSAVGVIGTTGT